MHSLFDMCILLIMITEPCQHCKCFLLFIASIHFICGAVMGFVNIYVPCDPLAAHAATQVTNGGQKDLLNRSFTFFKSIALVGLMR